MRRGFLFVGLLVGCAPSGPSTFEEGVTFDDVRPVFQTWCASCHLGDTARGDLSLSDAAALVEVAHPETGLDLVAPGDLEGSYLWHKLMDTHGEVGGAGAMMPPTGGVSFAYSIEPSAGT